MKTLFLIALSTILFQGFVKGNECKSTLSRNDIPVVKADSTYEVLVKHDIVYAQGLSHESVNSANATTIPLKLDVYEPDNGVKNRPVFMFVHGGGFVGGSKKQARIIEWANYYTSRGWVFISIDYRLKRDKGTVPKEWADFTANIPKNKAGQFLAVYPALRDAKAALRWIVANAKTYSINTNYITVGGGSAGAVAAIGIGISNQEDFRDEMNSKQDSTLQSTNLEQSYQISTIVDLWGGKTALDALEGIFGHQRFNRNNPSLFIAHGTKDPTVPFSRAEDLKAIYEANEVPFVFYPQQGKGHGAWGATVNNKHLYELAKDFIVEQQNLNVE